MTEHTGIKELAARIHATFRATAEKLRLDGPIVELSNNVCFTVGYTGVPYGIKVSLEVVEHYIEAVIFLAHGKTISHGYVDTNGFRQGYNLHEAFHILGIDESQMWNTKKAMINKCAPYEEIVALMATMIERHWPTLVSQRDRLFNVPPRPPPRFVYGNINK